MAGNDQKRPRFQGKTTNRTGLTSVLGLVLGLAVTGTLLEHRLAAAPQPRIVGGTTAGATEFANVAKLTITYKKGRSLCSGTLINPRWILTAAHCVADKTTSKVQVDLAGKTYFGDLWKTHPSYNPKAFSKGYDLALVRLSAPVVGVTPAVLTMIAPRNRDSLVIVGYGNSGTPAAGQKVGTYGIRRYGFVTVEAVTSQHVKWRLDKGEANTIAGGDSGGPAFLKGTATIVGVASGVTYPRGSGIGRLNSIAFEQRVDIHRNWINSTMASLKPRITVARMTVTAVNTAADALRPASAFGVNLGTLVSDVAGQ